MKQKSSDPSGPSTSHFRGIVSLTPSDVSPLVDSKKNTDDLTTQESTLPTILQNNSPVIDDSSMSVKKNRVDADGSHDQLTMNSICLVQPSEARIPSANHPNSDIYPLPGASTSTVPPLMTNVRSRKGGKHKTHGQHASGKRRQRTPRLTLDEGGGDPNENPFSHDSKCSIMCCRDRKVRRNIQSCMHFVARLLMWCTIVASVALVVWYSYELKNNGKDPHLIAWFSAGAFVLLGFPISLYGIVMHLANYNQPETQSYIVRILWMVPIYSIESWLCLRYKDYAIYIETLRDCYESYVLYCFLQFLIQVLGGEEALILMLKDKSPTRGSHMWGLQWCVKPWLMGQPVRKSYMSGNVAREEAEANPLISTTSPTAVEIAVPSIAASKTFKDDNGSGGVSKQTLRRKPLKRVHWTSPFYVKCKFGVLQYVLLKLLCSFAILILERYDLYKEGNFTYKGGYLYICVLTNLSQCWALYCLIFFYYATKNELAPIRPVGKFLSVKALVFFTWWQSVAISILYQMGLIPQYQAGGYSSTNKDDFGMEKSEPDWTVPMSPEDALAFDQMGGNAFWSTPTSSGALIDYSPEDVAKGMQDYLICIEMFVAAIVHTFVFPHSEYTPEAVEARGRALNQHPNKFWNKRLGRKWKDWDNKSSWSGTTAKSRDSEIEMLTMNQKNGLRRPPVGKHQAPSLDTGMQTRPRLDSLGEDDLMVHPLDGLDESDTEQKPLLAVDDSGHIASSSDSEDEYDDGSAQSFEEDEEHGVTTNVSRTRTTRKKNFVSALLDSTIPQDLRDNTVAIIKGDYVVEKKTLLHHAATSDSYDLFSRFSQHRIKEKSRSAKS